MTVTFINAPKSMQPKSGAEPDAAQNGVSAAKVVEGPINKAAALRNDLTPEIKIEIVPLSSVALARHPVRKQSKGQISRATRSIQRFGFRDPILLGKDFEIIDGHVRVEAARRLGFTAIPCIIASDLSDDDIRVLRIAKNRIQERGEWDEQALKLEFAFILEFEPDLTVTGFEDQEVDRILILDDHGPDEADPLDGLGALPQPEVAAVTCPGDLWKLGPHRILCGNARNVDDIHTVVGDLTVSAGFTDHPFNLSVKKDISVGSGKFAEFAEASGEMSESEYEDFLRITTGNLAAALRPGGVLFLCIDWRHSEVLMRVLRALGLELINLCVWGKDKPGMGSLYRSQHELVLVVKRPGAPHLNNVQLGIYGRNRSNLWRYAGATGGRKSEEDDFSLHPTVKPVRLVRDAILDVTAIGDVVLDPFLGSGTTLLAAELSRRICAGIEISPAYCDVAVGRWEKLTGLEAVHQATGLTFAALCDARSAADSACRTVAHPAAKHDTSSAEDF